MIGGGSPVMEQAGYQDGHEREENDAEDCACNPSEGGSGEVELAANAVADSVADSVTGGVGCG